MRPLLPFLAILLAGCTTLKDIRPFTPDATLIPNSKNCHYVVHGEGAIWWTTLYGWDLMKTDPQTRELLAHIRLPQDYAVFDMVTGHGAVWLAQGGSRPAILKVDARTARPSAKIPLASFWGQKGKDAHVAVSEDAVWATVNVLHKVFRIDPVTGAIVATIKLDGPTGRLFVAAGAVWVVTPDRLYRIDPATNCVVAKIAIPGLMPDLGRLATDGATFWVVSALPKVHAIDPETNQIIASFPVTDNTDAPANYFGVAQLVADRDALWAVVIRCGFSFLDPTYAKYSLMRVDRQTHAAQLLHSLGAYPALFILTGPSLAVTGHEAWVALPGGLYVVPLP